MSIIAHHLQALADAMGFEELSLDDEGACTLSFEDDVIVHLEAPEGSTFLALHAVAALLPEDPGDAFFEHLLAWNADPEGVPATLGWDGENNLVCACLRCEAAALDASAFVDLYEGFLAKVRQVRDATNELLDNPDTADLPGHGSPATNTPMHRV